MSRNRLDHPAFEGLYVIAGYDHALGLFAEVHGEHQEEPLHVLDNFTHDDGHVTSEDIFKFVVEHGFVTRDDLELCRTHMMDGTRRPTRLVPLSYLMADLWHFEGPLPEV